MLPHAPEERSRQRIDYWNGKKYVWSQLGD